MTHLFKIPLPNSNLFIRSITDDNVQYEVRDEVGKLLEPTKTTKYSVDFDRVNFDNRFISISLFNHIKEMLWTGNKA